MQADNAVTPPGAVSYPSRQQQAAPTADGKAGPSQPRLYQAARDGDIGEVKRLLAAGGIAVNAIDPETRLTPLMLAAWHGHDDVVFMLAKAGQGADLQLQNSRGDTALSLAAGAGKDDVVELLLLKKAQPDQANHSGRTPLAEAAAGGHLKTAELLIANGAQVNAGAGAGEPALTAAAQANHGALVELLLQKKANPDATDRYGWTAFNHAAGRGHEALAQQLRGNGASAGQASNTAQQAPTASVLPAATPAVNVDDGAATRQAVTRTTAITDTTTTMTATTVTSIVATQPAYAAPAAPAMPAMPAVAATESPAALRKAVEGNDVEALNRIVAAHPEQPAILNQPIAFTRQRGPLPAGSYTLLMLAAAHGHQPMVEALLALGADVNARGGKGKTALMLAADHRQLESVEALLKAGAEVDAQAEDGNTAVTLALSRRVPLTVSLLLQGVGNPDDIGSCLRQAAASGYVNTVRQLLKAGADVNGFDDVESKKKNIPPYEAIQNPHRHDAYFHVHCQEARRYYDYKGALNPFAVKEWADSLALFRAARNGHAAIVQALVEAGARVDANYYGSSLLSEVITKGDVDIMQLLLVARWGAQWRDCDQDIVQDDVTQAIMMAFRTDNLALQRDLLGSRAGKAAAWNKPELLEHAVRAENPGMVRMLLDAGASPNRTVNGHRPMLEFAATNGAGADVLAMLIDAGASLDDACRSIQTSPLVGAAGLNTADAVRFLLARMVNVPNAKQHIDAALWSACTGVNRRGERAEVAQILLDAGAEFKGGNGDIHTLLYQVAQDRHDEQLPPAAGTEGHVPRGRAAIVQLLLKHKANVNHDPGERSNYPSPLFAAVCTGKTAIVRLLLEAGAKTDVRDEDGRTPLQHAVRNEYEDAAALLRTVSTQGA